jgi:hypothetical protein
MRGLRAFPQSNRIFLYNATKFAGYGAAPAVLSIVYAAFHLTGIRYSCMAAVVVSSLLVIRGVYVLRKV